MKQINKVMAISCASFALLTSTHTIADTVLGGYVGVQAWNMSAEGGFSQDESIASFNFEEEANTNFYAALEHPIPLIPNIKLSRTTLDTTGTTVLDGQFTFGDEVYLVNSSLSTEVELTTTDYILYYEILDNDVISIDIGISGKQLDGDIRVVDENGRASQESIDTVIPMGYGRVQIGLPFTGLSLYAEGSGLAIDDDSFTDYQVALSYSFVESLALDMSIQAGYRSTEIDINDVDDIYADLTFDGAFIGLAFDF
jgi:outer membrane protein